MGPPVHHPHDPTEGMWGMGCTMHGPYKGYHGGPPHPWVHHTTPEGWRGVHIWSTMVSILGSI